jgi:hypothetical protein
MMYEVGSVGGPILSGAAMDAWPLYGLPIVVAVVAGALFVFGLVRNHRR